MATNMTRMMNAAQTGFQQLEAEWIAGSLRHLRRVHSRSDGGNGNIGHDFALDRAARLVFVRCHFSGGAGVADFHLRLRSRLSADWDVVLHSIGARGTGADVHFLVPGDENLEPSPWTLQPGDAVRCEWLNPDPGVMKWGLEVGLAMASV
jgi:hypothetical protein